MKSIVTKSLERSKKSKKKKKRRKRSSTKGTTDKDLEQTIVGNAAKIRVVGSGGSGNNTVARMMEIGIHGAKTIAVNTDAQHLLSTNSDEKALIGEKLTSGLGAGSNPEVGEAAAKESKDDLKKLIDGSNLLFITCGLGGGTGTGSTPVIAQLGKDAGALTVGIVTLPFSVEGKRRLENAINGLKKLKKACDTVIVIPNDKLLEIVPELPLNAAFKVADEVLTNAVKGITEMVTKTGLVNLDFADIKTILRDGGAAMIGLGESDTDSSPETRALEAIEEALNSPLLDVDISESDRALINVVGSADMTLKEAEIICEAVASKISPKSHIIWGAMIADEIPRNTIRTMVVVAGGKVPYFDIDPEAGPDLDIDYVK